MYAFSCILEKFVNLANTIVPPKFQNERCPGLLFIIFSCNLFNRTMCLSQNRDKIGYQEIYVIRNSRKEARSQETFPAKIS